MYFTLHAQHIFGFFWRERKKMRNEEKKSERRRRKRESGKIDKKRTFTLLCSQT